MTLFAPARLGSVDSARFSSAGTLSAAGETLALMSVMMLLFPLLFVALMQ